QRIFIVELAIEVRNTGNGRYWIPFVSASCMHHVEQHANQSTVPVVWISRYEFRTPNLKCDPLIFPALSPEADACYNWVSLLTCILYYGIIIWTHQWKVSTHESSY